MVRFACFLCLIVLITCGMPSYAQNAGTPDSPTDMLTVEGFGYPPIKVDNVAQARLMARRAAVLDAYRKALSKKGISDYSDEQLYAELDGFVKGMKIVNEEYLSDGGMKITADVASRDVFISSAVPDGRGHKQEKKSPLRISLEEWYEIIRKYVSIGE